MVPVVAGYLLAARVPARDLLPIMRFVTARAVAHGARSVARRGVREMRVLLPPRVRDRLPSDVRREVGRQLRRTERRLGRSGPHPDVAAGVVRIGPRLRSRPAVGSNSCSTALPPHRCWASTPASRAAATAWCGATGTGSSPWPTGCCARRTDLDARRSGSPCSSATSSDLFDEIRPRAVAVERILFQANARTAISVGQASGLALAAAARRGVPVTHYSPNEVKLAVTGYGAADKAQVQAMVTRLCHLDAPPSPPDAADALALAICHLWAAPVHAAADAAEGSDGPSVGGFEPGGGRRGSRRRTRSR